MTTTLGPGSVDLTNPDNFTSGVPHEYLTYMRENHPVWYQDLGNGHGYWHLFRYEDIRRVSKDPDGFSSAQGFVMSPAPPEGATDAQAGGGGLGLLIELDPPRHQNLRTLINKGFTPRRVAALEEHIREISREIVNEVIEKGNVDFVEEIAAKLPLAVICEMLGVPKEDWDEMFHASNRAIGSVDPEYATPETEGGDPASMMYLFGYFTNILATRKEQRQDDLVSVLLDAEIEGEKLTDEEILKFCFLLIIAGNETTRNATSHGMLALMENPAEWQKLTSDPSTIPGAIEEVVRWGSPVMNFVRTATKDTEVGGVAIKKGQKVLMWYPSANRDTSIWDDPFTFNVTRGTNDHIAFGYGEHFCLGANLARAELIAIFDEIARRMPDLELVEPPARLRSNFISGIKHMHVKFTPGARI